MNDDVCILAAEERGVRLLWNRLDIFSKLIMVWSQQYHCAPAQTTWTVLLESNCIHFKCLWWTILWNEVLDRCLRSSHYSEFVFIWRRLGSREKRAIFLNPDNVAWSESLCHGLSAWGISAHGLSAFLGHRFSMFSHSREENKHLCGDSGDVLRAGRIGLLSCAKQAFKFTISLTLMVENMSPCEQLEFKRSSLVRREEGAEGVGIVTHLCELASLLANPYVNYAHPIPFQQESCDLERMSGLSETIDWIYRTLPRRPTDAYYSACRKISTSTFPWQHMSADFLFVRILISPMTTRRNSWGLHMCVQWRQ